MVMWIIGLSGSGKSTLSEAVLKLARPRAPGLVHLDGDVVREVFGNDLGFTMADRRKNADRISRLCRFLESQGLPVICSILSLFPENRDWNHQNLREYHEVWIDAPLSDLEARDGKGLYRRARAGEIENVAGIDIPFAPPAQADIVIKNNASLDALLAHAPQLADILVNGRG